MGISITVPEQGTHYATTDPITVSGQGGPVDRFRLTRNVSTVVIDTEVSPEADEADSRWEYADQPANDWVLNLVPQSAGSYVIAVWGADETSDSRGFIVDP